MKRAIKLSILLLLISMLFVFNTASASTGINTMRIMGTNRFLTAIETSRAGWELADTVVLTRGDNYADALAGVSLAHQTDAPILLTATQRLNTDTLQEIRRLRASRIIILGGPSAISKGVEQELITAGLKVERIGGANRFDTAANIARRLSRNPQTAVVVYSNDFKDALVAAPYAARLGYPILLTGTKVLAAETAAVIQKLGIKNTVIIGNQDQVNDAVLASLPNPVRVGNPSHQTNAVSAADYFQLDNKSIYMATSADFADAITGAALAAKYHSAIFLVGDNVPPETSRYVKDKISSVSIFGGPSAVSYSLESTLSASTTPLFPVDLSVGGWDALTYFGGHTGTEYSAIDLNRDWPTNNADKGANVRAVANGVVVRIIPSHGQVHIRHTTALVHKNGTKYNTWYTTSVHMTDITVKEGDVVTRGQLMGKVGKVGTDSEHLHFSIQTKNSPTGTSSRQESYEAYTISPSWIGGDYDNLVYRSFYADAIETKIMRDIDQAPPGN